METEQLAQSESGDVQSIQPQSAAQLNDAPTTSVTFGEQLVGLGFNPSNDDKVGRAKRLFASAADLLHREYLDRANEPMFNELYHHAIGEVLNAQMNVVKVLTLKY